jgi:hypothetical protein
VDRSRYVGEGPVPTGTSARSFLTEAHNKAIEVDDDKIHPTLPEPKDNDGA